MDLLLDLYGFANVLLHAAVLVARTVLLGAVAFWLGIAIPLAGRLYVPDAGRLPGLARRGVLAAGLATILTTLAATVLAALVLQASLDLSPLRVLGADFVLVGIAALVVTLLLTGLAWTGDDWPRRRRQAALLLAAAGSAGLRRRREPRHGADRGPADAARRDGAAPGGRRAAGSAGCRLLLAALRQLDPATARAVGRRYSGFAAAGVGLILLGAAGFWLGYIGGIEALYGTAYGAMSATKLVLLGLLLLLGARQLPAAAPAGRRARGAGGARGGSGAAAGPPLRRVRDGARRRGAGASRPPSPPSRRPPTCRTTASPGPRSTERFTPAWPRLTSPDHADLALPALQARLDAEWQARQADASPAPGLHPRRGPAAAAQRPGHRLERVQPPLGRHHRAAGGHRRSAGRDRAGRPGAALAAALPRPRRLHPAARRPRGLAARRHRPAATACAIRRWCSTSWPACWSRPSPSSEWAVRLGRIARRGRASSSPSP